VSTSPHRLTRRHALAALVLVPAVPAAAAAAATVPSSVPRRILSPVGRWICERIVRECMDMRFPWLFDPVALEKRCAGVDRDQLQVLVGGYELALSRRLTERLLKYGL